MLNRRDTKQPRKFFFTIHYFYFYLAWHALYYLRIKQASNFTYLELVAYIKWLIYLNRMQSVHAFWPSEGEVGCCAKSLNITTSYDSNFATECKLIDQFSSDLECGKNSPPVKKS